jgi:hypothetical protein
LGVSTRTFEDLMHEPYLPAPVQLGPRLLRWSFEELRAAIPRMPRQLEKQQPVRQQIARLKGQAGTKAVMGDGEESASKKDDST